MPPPPGPAPALEPIDLPPAIEQGVDMIYIDEELVPKAIQNPNLMHDISFDDWSGAQLDNDMAMNEIYTFAPHDALAI